MGSNVCLNLSLSGQIWHLRWVHLPISTLLSLFWLHLYLFLTKPNALMDLRGNLMENCSSFLPKRVIMVCNSKASFQNSFYIIIDFVPNNVCQGCFRKNFTQRLTTYWKRIRFCSWEHLQKSVKARFLKVLRHLNLCFSPLILTKWAIWCCSLPLYQYLSKYLFWYIFRLLYISVTVIAFHLIMFFWRAIS